MISMAPVPPARNFERYRMEIREFICPGYTTVLDVEAALPGFPVVFDFLPDLETF